MTNHPLLFHDRFRKGPVALLTSRMGSFMESLVRCATFWSLLGGVLVAFLAPYGATALAGDIRVDAVAGEPFGVGEISFPIDSDDGRRWQSRAIHLSEANDRVVYPILEPAGIFSRVASAMEGNLPSAPPRASISFLFVGDAPLELSVPGLNVRAIRVTPRPHQTARHARMCRNWWKHVWGTMGDRINDNNRPRPVENYVAGMGLCRLNINRHPARRDTSTGTIEEMVIGTARMRSNMSRMVAFGWADQGEANCPLLPAFQWTTVQVPPMEHVGIEEIAYRVPDDCVYLRFAKFTNMLWSLGLLESHGEELQRLITTRGFRVDAGKKIQSQLAIQELPFANLIGDRLVDDVALIGRDIFLTDGAAIGIVLRVKSSFFTSGIKRLRQQTVKRLEPSGATEQLLTIAGREVSLISTPDNRLRSFHVVDGDWQLLTNSRAIAESFLKTADEQQPSLADIPAFQKLRSEMPADRKDTLFAYVSTRFLQAFTSPAYLVELQRRIRARAELSLLEVAHLAAEQEDRALRGAGREVPAMGDDLVESLRLRGMLPPGFAVRADGSRPQWQNGAAVDSLRGGKGTFLPVPDVEVTMATEAENRVYQQFVSRHLGNWSALDPVVLRLRKRSLPEKPGRDELEIDLRVTPLQPHNAAILMGLTGQHRLERVRLAEDTLISVQGIVNSRWVPTKVDTHMQWVVSDGPRVEPVDRARIADILMLAKRVPMRLLVDPADSAFDRTWWQPAVPTEEGDYFFGPFGLIGRRMTDHAAIAFEQSQLLDTPPNLDWERVESPAQMWVHVGDLTGSSIEDVVRNLAAIRSTKASIRNVQIFHQWTGLLGLSTGEGLDLVRTLVGMEPVCPLGGDYLHVATGLPPDAAGRPADAPNHPDRAASVDGEWASSRWSTDSMAPEDLNDYYPALLDWFHGVDASLDLGDEGMHLKATVEVAFSESDNPPSDGPADSSNRGEARPGTGFKIPFGIFGLTGPKSDGSASSASGTVAQPDDTVPATTDEVPLDQNR